jgi:hypothetical protein
MIWSLGMVSGAQLAPEEIVRRSVIANENDWRAEPSYSHLDRTVETKDGEITDRTYEVRMLDGSPYRRLTAIGGDPISTTRRQQEDQQEKHELARRRGESPEQRQARIDKYRKDRDHDHLLMVQMAAAFKFKLSGEDTLDGHRVYILDATPNPSYRPPNREAKVLAGMRGKLWVDAERFHWVKVEAEVTHTVTFGGFIAKVGPGTMFELENAPVDADTWLPKTFSMHVRESILLWQRNSNVRDEFSDYRRASGPSIASAN